MKVRSDHRSKFSNLSNWKEEAWKISGLQRDSNPWPPGYQVMLDQLSCEATHWERGQFVDFISPRVILQIRIPGLTLGQISFNLAHGNEAWWADFHKDKRIMNWQRFMNNVYYLICCFSYFLFACINLLFVWQPKNNSTFLSFLFFVFITFFFLLPRLS